jgi:HPt (histidine-containing phosphotransfer) domain-containing protein
VTTTSQGIEELEAAVAAGERTRVRLLAHKMRSGGALVYAHRVAAIAANIESEAMTAALPELAAATAACRRAFEAACRYIDSRLP